MGINPDLTLTLPPDPLRSCCQALFSPAPCRTWARMDLVPVPYQLPQMPTGPGERRPAPRLRRPAQGRYLGGVCAGLAEHLGLNVRHVRVAFVLASLVGGAGVAAYLLLWALTPQSPEVPAAPGTGTVPSGRPDNEAMRNLVVGLGLLVLGAAIFAQQHGVDLRLGFLAPLLAVAAGAALAWSRLDDTERGKWLVRGGASGRAGLVRLGMGVALATIGSLVLVTQGRGLAGLLDVGIAAIAVLAGAGLIAAPWVVRLWGDLRAEQAQRIRETERADIAAHLHDSVLQTLALIQRKADDPAEVTRLVRAQERERGHARGRGPARAADRAGGHWGPPAGCSWERGGAGAA